MSGRNYVRAPRSARYFDIYRGKFSILQDIIAEFVIAINAAATVCQCCNYINVRVDRAAHSGRIADRSVLFAVRPRI